MIQNSVIAHRLGGLDAQAVDDGADALGRGQALKHEALDRHVIDLGLDGRGAVGVDVEMERLEMWSDPLLAADRSKGALAQSLGPGVVGHHALTSDAAFVVLVVE